jgi:DNA-directed RNA polymerase I, II, and III subunit RPABC2
MSYFDDNDIGGGDGSDNDSETIKSDSDSESENELEENLGLEEVDDDDDVDDVDDVDEDEIDDDPDNKAMGLEGPSPQDENEAESDDGEEAEEGTKLKRIPKKTKNKEDLDDDDDDDDPTGEIYLKKFDKEINDNYLVNIHPESVSLNYDEILAMTKIVRGKNGIIIDDLHKTIPYLTKYEKARILGQRAKQINSGATAFVKVPEKVIDGYIIAELELQEKRVPFIIRRPLPNGGSEYWKVSDLENISF